MAYEKHTWETGETITAEKLNNLEDGVSGSGGILCVREQDDGAYIVLDKTFNEISTHLQSGGIAFTLRGSQNNITVKLIQIVTDQGYKVQTSDYSFYAMSADDYPRIYMD